MKRKKKRRKNKNKEFQQYILWPTIGFMREWGKRYQKIYKTTYIYDVIKYNITQITNM